MDHAPPSTRRKPRPTRNPIEIAIMVLIYPNEQCPMHGVLMVVVLIVLLSKKMMTSAPNERCGASALWAKYLWAVVRLLSVRWY